jgi:putative NIF3 family GTP cyclohydrolase 1 type 2
MGMFAEPQLKHEFLKKLVTVVGAEYLEVAWHGSERVHRVGLACGSAAEYLSDALEAKCDTFVTGEARFHSAVECQSSACNLVLTGHFSSERPAVVRLAMLLSERLFGVECIASDEDRNPLELFQLP